MTIPSFKAGVAGFYKIEAVRPDGSRRLLADWFQNVITDYGLDRLGTNNVLYDATVYCSVGTGNTPPAETDTQLDSYLAATSNVTSNNSGVQSTEPYYGWRRVIWRFAAGTATGNISELGVGNSPGGINLFSRSLVKDSGGTPVTVTVLADEALDVTYELRMYPPTGDVAFNITVGATNHSCVLRAYRVTQTSWSSGLGARMHLHHPFTGYPTGSTVQFSNGTIGAITATNLSGNVTTRFSDYGDSHFSSPAYVSNSYETFITVNLGLAENNISGGYSAGSISLSSIGAFQFSIDPAIPKDGTKNFTMTYKFSWGRYVAP